MAPFPHLPVEEVVFLAAALLLIAVLASRASQWLGIPSLLLFLGIGMLAGSEGPGGIYFDDAALAQFVGVLALVFILFAGGLETKWTSTRAVLWKGLSLSTVGVVLSASLVGAVARFVLGAAWPEALLLGAIVSPTDAAAVLGVLRSRSANLKGHLQPLLEFESGSNDPMAVFLTLALVRVITEPQASSWGLVLTFFIQMAVGGAAGVAAGRLTVALLNRLKLEAEGLYPVLTLGMMLATYGATTLVKGNGFLAVYVAGIAVGNAEFIHKRSLVRFHDGLAWLMQIAMFLALGLLVFPSRLAPVAGVGVLLSLFLMFVARPVSVFAALAFARLDWRQKLLTSWVGLRGAVPIILATFPRLAGVPNSDLYFNLVFFIVLTSVLLQGTTMPLVARWLGLEEQQSPRRQYPLEFVPTAKSKSELVEVPVPANSPAAGKQIVDLHLPQSALFVLLSRGDDFLAPRGATRLAAGDNVLVLAEKQDLAAIRAILGVED